MFNPNKINNQIIKNHNKKIKDIPDGKFFNVRPKPIILSSRPMMKIIKNAEARTWICPGRSAEHVFAAH